MCFSFMLSIMNASVGMKRHSTRKRMAHSVISQQLLVVLTSLAVVSSSKYDPPLKDGFNCTVPVSYGQLATPQSIGIVHYCAETFLFESVRKIRGEMAPKPSASMSYIAAAWEALNLPGSSKSKRGKCEASRTAIFVMGAPGSRRDELEDKWKPLVNKDCGYVRINAARIISGDDGFDLGKQVWQETFDRLSPAKGAFDIERCLKKELEFTLRIDWFLQRLLETALEELHSFVFESDAFVDIHGPLFTDAFSKLYKTHVFAVVTPINSALMNVWQETFLQQNGTKESKAQKASSVSGYRTPIPHESLCTLHESHTSLAMSFAVNKIDSMPPGVNPLEWPNFSLYEAPAAPATNDTGRRIVQGLRVIYQTDAKGSAKESFPSPFDKLYQIAQTSAASLEKQVEKKYGNNGKKALNDFKQLSLDCGLCGCDDALISDKAEPSEHVVFASAIHESYKRSGCSTISEDCLKEKDPCKHVMKNDKAILKCPRECGACYAKQSVGRGECSKTKDISKDASTAAWAVEAAKEAAAGLLGGSAITSWFSKPGKESSTTPTSSGGVPPNAYGCESLWKTLLKSDINTKDERDVKYKQNLLPEADAAGYLLIKPANAVSTIITTGAYNSKYKRQKVENRYSFWSFFKCNDSALVLDHCRFGAAGEPWSLKIPPSKFFKPATDPLAKDDRMVYVCRYNKHIVYPANEWLAVDGACKRVEGSQWCGAPPEIEANGCLKEWLSVQRDTQLSSKREKGFGRMRFKKNKRSIDIRLTCQKKQLKPEACYPEGDDSLTIAAGYYAPYWKDAEDFYGFYGCPHPKGYTGSELEMAIFVLGEVPKAWIMPRELNGFKPYQPSIINDDCSADWNVLIASGRLCFDDNGYVNIVRKYEVEWDEDWKYRAPSNAGIESLSAYFTCTKKTGLLTLDHCRIGENQLLPPGKTRKLGGGEYSCGKAETTTAANVADMVTYRANS